MVHHVAGINESLSTRRIPAVPTWSFPSRRSWEPWRDWAVIAVINNGLLILIALWHPKGLLLLLAAVPLSVGFAIGTLTVLHDAGHRMFSARLWPNVFAVHSSTPVGLWTSHWTLKHRVHHKFSQVYPLDESTRSSNLVRLHPAARRRSLQRWQHLYAWGLYGLAWAGELRSQLTYLRTGLIAGTTTPGGWRRAGSFLMEKTLCLLVLLPYAAVMGVGSLALLMAAAMTFASVIAAVVLTVGHINEGLTPEDSSGQSNWTANLMRTTASFSTESVALRWLTGGLTHHVAHHLRPVAVRSELPGLHRTVVPEAGGRAGSPPVEFATLRCAIGGHYRRLRTLGQSPAPPRLHVQGTVRRESEWDRQPERQQSPRDYAQDSVGASRP
jgi:linoleoyl-CoA desaturase